MLTLALTTLMLKQVMPVVRPLFATLMFKMELEDGGITTENQLQGIALQDEAVPNLSAGCERPRTAQRAR